MATLSSETLLSELQAWLDDAKLSDLAVLLVPPNIPLTCFPSAIEFLLQKNFSKEWKQLSSKARNYLTWMSVKAESIDTLVPEDTKNPTKGFELLAIDRNGRSFGGILEQCKELSIPSVLVRFASLLATLLTMRLLRRHSKLSKKEMNVLMFTQNVDADYLNYPMALKLLLQLFSECKGQFYLEVNEQLTADYLSTIRTLATDLELRLVLDDSNKMDSEVHWQLLDLADWIKIDFRATQFLEKTLKEGKGDELLWYFEKYANVSGSTVIVLEGLSEDSPLKAFLQKHWTHEETCLYYQSRERLPLPPWDRYFSSLQDYDEGNYGLFFTGLIDNND